MSLNSRYIPKDSEERLYPDLPGAAVYCYAGAGGATYAIAYHGKANKPDWHYRFRSVEAREVRIAEWAAGLRASAAYKAKRKEERKAKLAEPHTLRVGDVLSASWGYDQTNVDFYEVTALIGKRTVEIRPIAANSESTGYLCGTCVPLPGKYIGPPERKMVTDRDTIKVRSWGVWAHKVTPKNENGVPVYSPRYWSAYA